MKSDNPKKKRINITIDAELHELAAACKKDQGNPCVLLFAVIHLAIWVLSALFLSLVAIYVLSWLFVGTVALIVWTSYWIQMGCDWLRTILYPEKK
jgi:glucan phosphoethanolaminetransferase (alkaline phosphatase superfamily)